MSERWISKKNLVWKNILLTNSTNLCGSQIKTLKSQLFKKREEKSTKITITSGNLEKPIECAPGKTPQRDGFPNMENIKQNLLYL